MGQIPETAAARRALKVAEIKALLEEAGLATDGTKPVLLERLEEVRSRFYPAETSLTLRIPAKDPPLTHPSLPPDVSARREDRQRRRTRPRADSRTRPRAGPSGRPQIRARNSRGHKFVKNMFMAFLKPF